MDRARRLDLLDAIATGDVPLRDAAGLGAREVGALVRLGAVALETRRFEDAVLIFAGLEALEPDRPEHALALAIAEHGAGRTAAATAAIARYLDGERPRAAADLERARALHAMLGSQGEP